MVRRSAELFHSCVVASSERSFFSPARPRARQRSAPGGAAARGAPCRRVGRYAAQRAASRAPFFLPDSPTSSNLRRGGRVRAEGGRGEGGNESESQGAFCAWTSLRRPPRVQLQPPRASRQRRRPDAPLVLVRRRRRRAAARARAGPRGGASLRDAALTKQKRATPCEGRTWRRRRRARGPGSATRQAQPARSGVSRHLRRPHRRRRASPRPRRPPQPANQARPTAGGATQALRPRRARVRDAPRGAPLVARHTPRPQRRPRRPRPTPRRRRPTAAPSARPGTRGGTAAAIVIVRPVRPDAATWTGFRTAETPKGRRGSASTSQVMTGRVGPPARHSTERLQSSSPRCPGGGAAQTLTSPSVAQVSIAASRGWHARPHT